MNLTDQPVDSLRDVRDIRTMMERSSRFLSLSGFSGIAAGICALVGAGVANYLIFEGYYIAYDRNGYTNDRFADLRLKLLMLAALVFVAALVSAFWFTWRRSSKEGTRLWNLTSRKLFWNMAIPIAAGAVFIMGMLWHNAWMFVAPACLLFYGLALVNASKYTLTDIRYLGYTEIVLGLINMFFIGYGLLFWAVGFGVMHILYGVVMWYKYERKSKPA